jgi:putative ABC transport system substrate-binding protein
VLRIVALAGPVLIGANTMTLLARARRILAMVALLSLAMVAAGQPKDLPRIGWVISGTPENTRHLLEAMRAGLADEGLVDGRTVVLDVRFAAGRMERYPELFADLMRNPVNVLAAAGYVGISAARDASGGRIPVSAFFCGNDVKQMVESFARPGGNITGTSCLSAELVVKRVQLLKEAVPTLRRIGFLYDSKTPGKEQELAEVRESARKLGMSVSTATASAAENLREAIAGLRRDRAEALVISEDAFTHSNRVQIVALAAEHQMVDISSFRDFVVAGGVLSYGASLSERVRQQGRYAAKIILGAKPSDLPIDQPTRFEFVVNLKAARTLGITIPKAVLLRADEVIE